MDAAPDSSHDEGVVDPLDALALRARLGDTEAFHQLIVAVLDDLRGYCAGIAHRADLIEEVVQATLVAAFESLPRYEPRGCFLAWLKGIARNRLYKELHAHRNAARVGGDHLEEILCAASEEIAGDDHEGDLERLRQCLGGLAPRVRVLVERHHFEGVPLAVLARQFRQTVAALSMIMFRARGVLRTCVERGRP
jgi:RNA polymerase sigma-70 factor (ECF subfamily)